MTINCPGGDKMIKIKTERKTGLRTAPNGSIWDVIKLGYVTGIRYNSEGTLINWELGKHDLTGYSEHPHICKTIADAKKHFEKIAATRTEEKYIRPYYLETLIKEA